MSSERDIALRVDGLGKHYRLGATVDLTRSFRETVMTLPRFFGQKARGAVARLAQRGSDGAPAGDSESTDSLWALRDVSFDVGHGEVVGVIGRNGAGKSTLLKILSRITSPTEGRADIHGRLSSLLEVGTGFHPELTGRENIYLNGAILGMRKSEIAAKFDEIVAFAEVERFLDTPVKRYSSGMYVRLAFAVAAHLEPDILLVDEVLAVGDAEFQRKCLGVMGDVARGGRTVLFVSHNMAAIEGLCPRTIVLDDGGLAFDGPTGEALQRYAQSIRANSDTPLREREDRRGSGAVRAVAVEVFDDDGRSTDTVGMGESFSVVVETEGNLKNAVIGVLFGDATREQLIRAFSWEQISEPVNLTGRNRIRCRFRDFPMMHGEYVLGLWIGLAHEAPEDYVQGATRLRVEPRDVYATGRSPDPRGGIAFCQTEWQIEDS